MHLALQIEEILLNIFGRCHTTWLVEHRSDLPALARTCRAFKEPALDLLWEHLDDPSPIARCIPGAYKKRPLEWGERYAFHRSPTENEWETLQTYTHRIHSIEDGGELEWESVLTFIYLPPNVSLLPNLWNLSCYFFDDDHPLHVLDMYFPSLIFLSVSAPKNRGLSSFDITFLHFCDALPHIRSISINVDFEDRDTFDMWSCDRFSTCVRGWHYLQTVACSPVALDADTVTYLSRLPTLTKLVFMVSDELPQQIAPPDPSVSFPNLCYLALFSRSLDLISQFLSRIQLPALTIFSTNFNNRPSKQDLSFFWHAVQVSGIGTTVRRLHLDQKVPADGPRAVLGFEDLQPCMMFRHICDIEVNIEWGVDLTSDSLLAWTSGWPQLRRLVINTEYGWNTQGGITLNGLRQLLQAHQSLTRIVVAVDTRGYIKYLPAPEIPGLTPFPRHVAISIVDSIIEAESVPALASFFASITKIGVWCDSGRLGWVHRKRWDEVARLVREIICRRL